ncbi:hypothetical protein KA531_00385 [Candidatus Saccharibacteria bacterium]|nr:hypothetical protein [Candidatus Saccharibacteria bacterium]
MLRIDSIHFISIKKYLNAHYQYLLQLLKKRDPGIFLGLDIGTEQVKAVLAKYNADSG